MTDPIRQCTFELQYNEANLAADGSAGKGIDPCLENNPFAEEMIPLDSVVREGEHFSELEGKPIHGSWYGGVFQGDLATNGSTFNTYEPVIAITDDLREALGLEFDDLVIVSYGERSVVARVTDRKAGVKKDISIDTTDGTVTKSDTESSIDMSKTIAYQLGGNTYELLSAGRAWPITIQKASWDGDPKDRASPAIEHLEAAQLREIDQTAKYARHIARHFSGSLNKMLRSMRALDSSITVRSVPHLLDIHSPINHRIDDSHSHKSQTVGNPRQNRLELSKEAFALRGKIEMLYARKVASILISQAQSLGIEPQVKITPELITSGGLRAASSTLADWLDANPVARPYPEIEDSTRSFLTRLHPEIPSRLRPSDTLHSYRLKLGNIDDPQEWRELISPKDEKSSPDTKKGKLIVNKHRHRRNHKAKTKVATK